MSIPVFRFPVCTNITEAAISCGIRQLHGLANMRIAQGGEAIMATITFLTAAAHQAACSAAGYTTHSERIAFFIFSDADSAGNGIKLAEYIKKNDLGPIQESPSIRNPNSPNNIRCWMWQWDKDKVYAIGNPVIEKARLAHEARYAPKVEAEVPTTFDIPPANVKPHPDAAPLPPLPADWKEVVPRQGAETKNQWRLRARNHYFNSRPAEIRNVQQG